MKNSSFTAWALVLPPAPGVKIHYFFIDNEGKQFLLYPSRKKAEEAAKNKEMKDLIPLKVEVSYKLPNPSLQGEKK